MLDLQRAKTPQAEARVVATVIGTAIVIGRFLAIFLRITLSTNQFVNKNMHTCFYVHLALQQPKYIRFV